MGTNATLVHFGWNEAYVLGHSDMDDTHREFVTCVDALLKAPDAGQGEALDAFSVHVRGHFAEEDRWMRETGYGNAGCHLDDHAAVLKSLDEVLAALAAGRHDVVRAFAHALAGWFPEHASVMDQGLARWLVQRRLGGSPVLIRHLARVRHEASAPPDGFGRDWANT